MTENIYWSASRDKYGRPVRHMRRDGKTVGVAISMPKSWTEVYAERFGGRYMVNNWTIPVPAGVGLQDVPGALTYHKTFKAAQAYLESVIKAS